MTEEMTLQAEAAIEKQTILRDDNIYFLYNYYCETGYLLYFTAFCSPLASVSYLEHAVEEVTDKKCLNRSCRVDTITDMLKANGYVADFVFSRDTDNRGTIATVVVGERLVYGVKWENFRDVYLDHLRKFYNMLAKNGYYMPSICWEILPNIMRSFLEYKFTQLYRLESGVDVVIRLTGDNDLALKVNVATTPKDIIEDFDAAMYSVFNTKYKQGMLTELCTFIDLRLKFDSKQFLSRKCTPAECLELWLRPAKLSAAVKAIKRAMDWLKSLGLNVTHDVGGAEDGEVS